MNKFAKSILSVTAAITIAAATLTPVIVNAWGDNAGGRPSYTIAEINNGKLGDTITFNSISDGKIGNEKYFVGARLNSSDTWHNDNIVNPADGAVYTVRLYVHNNSPKGTARIAENVTANFDIPTTTGKELTIKGVLNSSNATPTQYWDEVTFKSSDYIYLEYVDGSAQYENAKMGTVKLANEVITSGVKLGYDKLDGRIPGCYEYDGVVTIKVKVHKSAVADINKLVRIKGTDKWYDNSESNKLNAKVGDTLQYQIRYKNLLSETVSNVTVRDVLPSNLSYVKGTTYLYNSNNKDGLKISDNITTEGVNIGDYKQNGNAAVIFEVKVVDDNMVCNKTNELVNKVGVTVNGITMEDRVSVDVPKTCKSEPTPTPTPEPTPEPEPTPVQDTPTEIVSTGPATIITGAVGAGSVVTALGYYIASRKKLM